MLYYVMYNVITFKLLNVLIIPHKSVKVNSYNSIGIDYFYLAIGSTKSRFRATDQGVAGDHLEWCSFWHPLALNMIRVREVLMQ